MAYRTQQALDDGQTNELTADQLIKLIQDQQAYHAQAFATPGLESSQAHHLASQHECSYLLGRCTAHKLGYRKIGAA
jgi:hypothetical protein